jgi:hypothetical protein
VTINIPLTGALSRKKSSVRNRSARPETYVTIVSEFPLLEFPSQEINVTIDSRPVNAWSIKRRKWKTIREECMHPRATAFSQQNIILFESYPNNKKTVDHMRR